MVYEIYKSFTDQRNGLVRFVLRPVNLNGLLNADKIFIAGNILGGRILDVFFIIFVFWY